MIAILIIITICLMIYISHNKAIPVFLFHHIHNNFENYVIIIKNIRITTLTFSDVWLLIQPIYEQIPDT